MGGYSMSFEKGTGAIFTPPCNVLLAHDFSNPLLFPQRVFLPEFFPGPGKWTMQMQWKHWTIHVNESNKHLLKQSVERERSDFNNKKHGQQNKSTWV